MTSLTRRGGFSGLALLGLLLVSPAVNLDRGSFSAPAYALTPMKPFGQCAWCQGCAPGNMKMEGELDDEYGVVEDQPCIAEMCGAGGCPRNPIPPGPPPIGPEAIAAVWNRISTYDVQEIRKAIAEYPENVEVNRDRQSIQIISCSNSVLGSVTLDERQFNALVAELQMT